MNKTLFISYLNIYLKNSDRYKNMYGDFFKSLYILDFFK